MGQKQERVLSGMQPSGQLHIGNWLGALDNWVHLQDMYDSYFMVADWHALTSRYHNTDDIPVLVRDMVVDWLATGLDPERSVIFVQSWVPQHAELFLLLSMVTPLGWLERVPTYKEKLRELAQRDIHTYGFLGYPVLQAADIAVYDAVYVPVGQDQLPHIELTREMVRRFNGLYGAVLVEPEALLTEAKVVPGTDGRKMSKSYGNTLTLSESSDSVLAKLKTMVTDPARVRRSDPGDPEACPVYSLHKLFTDADERDAIGQECRTAAIGCVACKARLAQAVNQRLEPVREARQRWLQRPDEVEDILRDGSARARQVAEATLSRVRAAMHFGHPPGD